MSRQQRLHINEGDVGLGEAKQKASISDVEAKRYFDPGELDRSNPSLPRLESVRIAALMNSGSQQTNEVGGPGARTRIR
ncbi:hypothetical protein RMSM_06574 [Rhodopirellula maiorica SM1]|uniref:Uncharacterized protein n=1 Tax=Rhodopirellula maiorica SM1 TaxID=1265738 RepID=M5RBQ2_9BACT|nr:hypothetical protein RMSM_06574 [Rhodopirellula maiorica SM1]